MLSPWFVNSKALLNNYYFQEARLNLRVGEKSKWRKLKSSIAV